MSKLLSLRHALKLLHEQADRIVDVERQRAKYLTILMGLLHQTGGKFVVREESIAAFNPTTDRLHSFMNDQGDLTLRLISANEDHDHGTPSDNAGPDGPGDAEPVRDGDDSHPE